MRKAGFRKRSNDDYYPQDQQTSSSSHHDTIVSTYKSQSDYAKHNIKGKVVDGARTPTGARKKKVVKTADRVRHLKALRKQMGGSRTSKPVHDVSIHAKDGEEHKKNDRSELITRGKSFKKRS